MATKTILAAAERSFDISDLLLRLDSSDKTDGVAITIETTDYPPYNDFACTVSQHLKSPRMYVIFSFKHDVVR